MTKATYYNLMLLRDLKQKLNARPEDVRLILKRYAVLVPASGEIPFSAVRQGFLNGGTDFAKTLYNLFYGTSGRANAGGDIPSWMQWAEGAGAALTGLFGVLNKKESESSNDALLEYLKEKDAGNGGTSTVAATNSASGTWLIVGGVLLAVALVAVAIAVVMKKKK